MCLFWTLCSSVLVGVVLLWQVKDKAWLILMSIYFLTCFCSFVVNHHRACAGHNKLPFDGKTCWTLVTQRLQIGLCPLNFEKCDKNKLILRRDLYFPISDISHITSDQYTFITDMLLLSNSYLMSWTGPCVTCCSHFLRICSGSLSYFTWTPIWKVDYEGCVKTSFYRCSEVIKFNKHCSPIIRP